MGKVLGVAVVVFAAVLALASAGRGADSDDEAVKAALVALETQSWVAWKARDGKFFDGFLSDDHIEIHANGLADKHSVVVGVASPACTVASYKIGDMKFTRLAADAAVLVYHAE